LKKGFEMPLFLLCGLKPRLDFPKKKIEMLRHSQSWIFLLKLNPQFSQDKIPSFEEIHNFCKNYIHTCKKNFYKSFISFKNQFLSCSILLPRS